MLEALGRRTAELGVDLGTSNTRIVVRGTGLVVEEPTVVAIQNGPRGRTVLGVGTDAKRMLGRTPAGTRVIRPVLGGVVDDFEATERLLRALIKQTRIRSLLRPRMLICIPAGTTEVERRAVQESARAAGAREVFVVSTAVAAALGADLPITDPVGSMIVDIGGGRTEVAILSLGGVVVRRSLRLAGDAMDEAIAKWLRLEHTLLIGDRTRESIKIRVGCAQVPNRPLRMRIRGRDAQSGGPREIDVSSDHVAEALIDVVEQIKGVVIDALGATPPELASDIIDRGIIICGGGSELRGLGATLRDAVQLPVLQADEPMHCVSRGASILLEDQALFERVTASV
ncbi:MAG: rod shape-determining protein [Proteobacteria bacterium]|nr:rod shape-determining protein [Pseudomonadota bacterium]